MKKCAKCGKFSEDGKVWFLKPEVEVKTLEIIYCPFCDFKMEMDFCNLIFWRKNNETY